MGKQMFRKVEKQKRQNAVMKWIHLNIINNLHSGNNIEKIICKMVHKAPTRSFASVNDLFEYYFGGPNERK